MQSVSFLEKGKLTSLQSVDRRGWHIVRSLLWLRLAFKCFYMWADLKVFFVTTGRFLLEMVGKEWKLLFNSDETQKSGPPQNVGLGFFPFSKLWCSSSGQTKCKSLSTPWKLINFTASTSLTSIICQGAKCKHNMYQYKNTLLWKHTLKQDNSFIWYVHIFIAFYMASGSK